MPGICLDFEENQIGKHFLCTLCLLLLRAPVQTVCGHRCCYSCVKQKKGLSDNFVCPEDGTLVTEVFPDRFVEREVLNLPVKCKHVISGCDWKGIVKDYEAHIKVCQFEDVTCPNEGCSLILKQRDLERHLETECNYRQINCKACGISVHQAFLKKHQQTDCPAAKVKCNQCGKDIVRAQLKNHQENECDEAVVMCQFTKVGCAAKRPMKKNDRRKHMENASVNHITYILKYVLDLEKQIGSLREDWEEGKGSSSLERAKFDIDTEAEESLPKKSEASYTEKSSQAKLQTSKNFSEYSSSKGATVSDSVPFDADITMAEKAKSLPYQNQSNLEALVSGQLNEFSNRLQVFGMEILDCQKEQGSLQSIMAKNTEDSNRRIDAFRDLLRKLENRVTSLETSLQMKDVHIMEQNERLSFVEDASYSGTLIWPITNYMKQRHDSIIGKNTSVYSPYFYTSKYGYKMRLRIYLNGDGIGKASHISLFFVLCKGRYDSLLSWPFRQKVTMTILDQDHVKDVSDSFKPDPSSSSFQKPRNAMNIASGCPLFMPITLLDTHAYIRDDTLYVKADVDTMGLTL